MKNIMLADFMSAKSWNLNKDEGISLLIRSDKERKETQKALREYDIDTPIPQGRGWYNIKGNNWKGRYTKEAEFEHTFTTQTIHHPNETIREVAYFLMEDLVIDGPRTEEGIARQIAYLLLIRSTTPLEARKNLYRKIKEGGPEEERLRKSLREINEVSRRKKERGW